MDVTAELPDLLHDTPFARVDVGLLRERMRFAFAAGGADVPLCESFDEGRVAASTFVPEYFESDLYLEDFLRAHLHFDIRGRLFQARLEPIARVLAYPPSAQRHMLFRQAILRELSETPSLRAELEEAYVAAVRLRGLLGESGIGGRLDTNRRRVETLEAAATLFDVLARGFAGAQSGLSRLRQFGLRVQGQSGYERLKQLLQFEDGAASIDARLQIGYDGYLRNFEIVGLSNVAPNPFYASFWGRLVRGARLFLSGFRFGEGEVLGRFVDEVFAGIEDELVKVFQLLCDLEFYLVALRFRDRALEHGLRVCLAEVQAVDANAQRVLCDLFNPLLLVAGERTVPCTVGPQRHSEIVLLTGPNSGGKTRLLQALSLAQILGQGGFFVPAAEATLVRADSMYLSIGEHGSAGQREGRLGSELLRIRKVFESVLPGAFVAVDELCSGTNPSEGEEIFRMVLSLLKELGPQAFISTHFLEFAAALSKGPEREGLDFLRVELDPNDQPTYRFVKGVASTSLARQTAARLGVTAEELRALIDSRKQRALQPS